jgi:hypothetical protein
MEYPNSVLNTDDYTFISSGGFGGADPTYGGGGGYMDIGVGLVNVAGLRGSDIAVQNGYYAWMLGQNISVAEIGQNTRFFGPSSGATATGSISGDVLFVSTHLTGNFRVGQMLLGTGVSTGTYITAKLTGTGANNSASYRVNITQSVNSTTITGTYFAVPCYNTSVGFYRRKYAGITLAKEQVKRGIAKGDFILHTNIKATANGSIQLNTFVDEEDANTSIYQVTTKDVLYHPVLGPVALTPGYCLGMINNNNDSVSGSIFSVLSGQTGSFVAGQTLTGPGVVPGTKITGYWYGGNGLYNQYTVDTVNLTGTVASPVAISSTDAAATITEVSSGIIQINKSGYDFRTTEAECIVIGARRLPPSTVTVNSIVSTGGTTTIMASDDFVCVTGVLSHTLTLPAALSGRRLTIKNRSTATVTINSAGSDTIDGGTTIPLNTTGSVVLIANGTDWTAN